MRLLTFLILGFFASIAQAAPVTWTFNNVVFDDGTQLTGSFTYDIDTNTTSDINIFTQGNNLTYPGFADWTDPMHYNSGGAGGGGIDFVFISTAPSCSSCNPNLNLSFYDPFLGLGLSNAGGEYVWAPSPFTGSIPAMEGTEIAYSYLGSDQRSIVSGSISSVPIPDAAWLFGTALAGLGWLRRKQTT